MAMASARPKNPPGAAVDIIRKRSKIRRRLIHGAIIAAILGLIGTGSLVLASLRRADPSVDRATVFFSVVKRGEMVCEVRGPGTLAATDIDWVSAAVDGMVVRTPVLPGQAVTADTVLVELVNPQLVSAANEARFQVKSAESDLRVLQAKLRNEVLDLEASTMRAEAEAAQAKVKLEIAEQLFRDGLETERNLKLARVQALELDKLLDVERRRLDVNRDSAPAQTAAASAHIDELRSLSEAKQRDVESLRPTAGLDGVLQQLAVEPGQRVTPGTTIAKVTNPRKLKAVLRIPETEARDVALGQPARIDTRNAISPGQVTRIDPAVIDGAVKMDVAFDGPPPAGARPDLSVDGTIEVERIRDCLCIGRPVFAQSNGSISLFRLESDGVHARRVPVHLGKGAVDTVQVVSGLREGDRVIISDTSQWDSADRIAVK
jgi:HlyD family secretion protein